MKMLVRDPDIMQDSLIVAVVVSGIISGRVEEEKEGETIAAFEAKRHAL